MSVVRSHKASCPPYVIRESPGKGRGLFATRRIKEGQIILEEYPLLVFSDDNDLERFTANHYPNIDEETKAKILKLNDPADDFKVLDAQTVEELVTNEPFLKSWKEPQSDEMSKIYRIYHGNAMKICEEEDLYSNPRDAGIYNTIHRINHSCVPNATKTWVMGDFRRKQVRAMMVIEKDEEILLNYRNTSEFVYGSRESRQRRMLQLRGFLCECSECSLEGEDLEENDRMREEIKENHQFIFQFP